MATAEPLPPDRVDLYATGAAEAAALTRCGVPVIAWGPAIRLRGAFLDGCDDYLREPWLPEELEMRALAVLQRMRERYRFPWGEMSLHGNTLAGPGGRTSLTRFESLILRALLRSRGSPVPREALCLLCTGRHDRQGSRAMDMHVSGLRGKVRAIAPDAGRFVTCVRGQGYVVD